MARPKTRNPEDKAFHFRMPRETWFLLKKASVYQNTTMSQIVVDLVEKSRNKFIKNFEKIEKPKELK